MFSLNLNSYCCYSPGKHSAVGAISTIANQNEPSCCARSSPSGHGQTERHPGGQYSSTPATGPLHKLVISGPINLHTLLPLDPQLRKEPLAAIRDAKCH